MPIARKFVEGAGFNLLKNLKYYLRRDKPLDDVITRIGELQEQVPLTGTISELMGIEGNMRQFYYQGFDEIITDFEMGTRTRQPPQNEINTLISFGNMMCYTLCLDQLYHTPALTPPLATCTSLAPGGIPLALDLAEIFKPVLVDRIIFRTLNKKEIKASDFSHEVNRCVLKESGRKKFARIWEERLAETIKHRALKKNVSYRHLVKLECYKLSKHILGMEAYKPFKAWW